MKLVSNLYAYLWQGSDNNCNSCVFANALSGNRHVMVDPGHINTPSYREPALDTLAKAMKADGLDLADTGLVILTHCHPDHTEASSVFREKYHAQVAIHEMEAAIYKMLGGTADLLLREGELELGQGGETKLDIIHSPGHSPGHITIYWPLEKVLIAGDVIFYGSTGRVDLPGGNPAQLKQSIERISELEIEYLLCGHPYGHPGLLEGKQEIQQNFDTVKRSVLF
jgi:glyoxylase-like metal-dependent hydrolase (beta-lactamase superfamily II)